MFILFLFLLNLTISALNAWGCGKSWNETKYLGGLPHFLNWMGAIMAACGFTWCNLVILGLVGSVWPVEQDDGTTAMLLSRESLQAFFELGYIAIIVPLIGSGTVLTINSWIVFWRKRTLLNGAVAGWNTFADIYNIASAAQHLPGMTSHLGSFFKDNKDNRSALVIALVATALFGSILTTWLIITKTAKSTAFERMAELEAQKG